MNCIVMGLTRRHADLIVEAGCWKKGRRAWVAGTGKFAALLVCFAVQIGGEIMCVLRAC